jgi:hypothetical protein
MGRESSGHDSHSSHNGVVVIVGMMVAPSMESAVPGMLMSATAFVVVATMTIFGAVAHAPLAMMLIAGAMTGRYGLLAPGGAQPTLTGLRFAYFMGCVLRARPRRRAPSRRQTLHSAAPSG